MTTTYTLLIYRTAKGDVEPRDIDDALRRHRTLQANTAKLGTLHAVAQLENAGHARTVRVEDGAHDVADGPYIETKEWLVGFYLVDCEDEAQAVDYARQLMPSDDWAVEVRPVQWRWEQ